MLVLDIILGVAVLALLIYRQLSSRPVNASALRLIAVLAIIGVLQTVQFLNKNPAHPLTYAAIGGSLVLAATFGVLRASTIRIWLQDNQAWSKGNWMTAALWIASAHGRTHGGGQAWLHRLEDTAHRTAAPGCCG